jgi:hypothetical protein
MAQITNLIQLAIAPVLMMCQQTIGLENGLNSWQRKASQLGVAERIIVLVSLFPVTRWRLFWCERLDYHNHRLEKINRVEETTFYPVYLLDDNRA